MTKERITASINEFARIVGVDHKAVQRSIERGGRLEKSLVVENGRTRIAICDGCVEWVMNKDHRKDHRTDPGEGMPGIMSRDVSSEMDRHYSALMKRLEYAKACKELIPVATVLAQSSEALRTFRDTMMNIPLVVSDLLRPLTIRILRGDGEELSPEKQKLMDDAVLQLRQAAKREVHKALNHAADIIDDERKRDEERRLNKETMDGV